MSGRILVSKKLILVNSASSLTTRIFSITVLIWVQQYLLKRISVEEYSLLPVVFSIMIFLPFVVSIFTSGIKRYIAEAYDKGDDERIIRIVSSMFPFLCLASFILILIGGALVWHVDRIIRIDPKYLDHARIMLVLIIGVEALRLPIDAFSSGIYVHQRFVLENLILIASEFFRILILFLLLFYIDVSVIYVVLASSVASIISISAIFFISRRLLPSQQFKLSKFDRSIVTELLRFGGWNSVYGFSGMIRKAADPIILNRLATPLDVTCFHLGALVPNRLEVLANSSFVGSVAPMIVGLHSDKQEEKLKRTYLRLGRFALWGMLVVICPFLVHFEQIVILYVGETYLAAGVVMFLLLGCYPIVYGNILHWPLASAKLRMRSLAFRESVSAVLNLGLTLILVGYYQMGAIGAAISTFLIYGLGSILLFWPFGKDIASVSWNEIWIEILAPGITPFVAAIISMKLLASAYFPDTWLAIATNAMLGGGVYLLVLWFVAKEIDRSQFRSALLNLRIGGSSN